MFERVSFLIPYKPDNGIRDINFKWIKKFYKTMFPGAEICVGISTEKLFNRSQAINLAAKQATRDIFVIADADIFYDPVVIKDAIEHIDKEKAPWIIPFRYIKKISQDNSSGLLKAAPAWPLEIRDFEWIDISKYPFHWVGHLNVITRDRFMAVGGFDERFKGWGGEDDAFSLTVNTIHGRYKRLKHTIYHLWHPVVGYHNNPNAKNNLKLLKLYGHANNDKMKMKQVISNAEGIFHTSKDRKKEKIRIVAVTNDTYAKHLAVMLRSLFKNKLSSRRVKIYVMYSKMNDQNKSLLTRTVEKYHGKINFVQIDPAKYSGFKTFAYLTQETYYRISIPDLFHEKVDKVLYLDSDIIVKGDITELWDTDISRHYLGAVYDYWVKKSRNDHLLMPKSSKYFNAGVLLINLKKWRQHDIKNKIINFINTHSSRIKYCDQDALNAVLHDRWLELDPKWNFQSHHLSNPKLKIKPAIIHYTGIQKPWNSDHPLKKYYFRYAKRIL